MTNFSLQVVEEMMNKSAPFIHMQQHIKNILQLYKMVIHLYFNTSDTYEQTLIKKQPRSLVIEGLVEKFKQHGGKQRMPIREYYPGEKPYKMVYVEDPFGNIFEIYTHSYELTYSQGAY